MITVTLNAAIDRVMQIEGFRVGGHQRGCQVARVLAGKGVNVSRALAQLGVGNIATGFVGRGQLQAYEQSLEGTGVRPQFLAVDGDTRENVTIIDPLAGVETHIRDEGAAVSAADVGRLSKKLNLLARPGSLVMLCGSLPPGLPPESAVGFLDLAVAGGARVVVDGPGALLEAAVDRRPWLIKPNVEELGAMIGRAAMSDNEIREAGKSLSQRCHVVMVTCGAAGGYLFIDGSAMMGQVSFDPSRVVSTVGCGDVLLGAFVACHLSGKDARSSYRYALAAATAAAVEQQPGRFSPALVEELLPDTSVEHAD